MEGIGAEFEAVGLTIECVESLESFMDVSNPKLLVDTFLRSKNPGAMSFVSDYWQAELNAFADEVLRLIEEKCLGLPRKLKRVMIVIVWRRLD